MKILIVTQYFYPETFKSSDLAFELQRRGHDVTVLTGIPNYPEGRVFKGYGLFKRRTEEIRNVKVYRTFLIPRGKGGGLRLFLNYYSWAFSASLKAKKLAKTTKYDAIIVHEPSPITQFYPAWIVSKTQDTPIYFWVMDLWPESLSIAGGIKNKFILNYYKALITKFYKRSKKILVTSKGFIKSICEKGDFQDKIEYFPNWAEDVISEGNISYPIPKLPEGFKVMFAGNIGEAQDMENVLAAFLHIKRIEEIKLIIIGSGRRSEYVENFVEEHNLKGTVFCFGHYPVEAMASFFHQADLLLVSLKDDPIFNLTVPAKVQAYMSSGIPLIGMLNGEGAEIIQEADCGFTVSASDYISLGNSILGAYKTDKAELQRKGENGKVFYRKHFKMSECITNLERIIEYL